MKHLYYANHALAFDRPNTLLPILFALSLTALPKSFATPTTFFAPAYNGSATIFPAAHPTPLPIKPPTLEAYGEIVSPITGILLATHSPTLSPIISPPFLKILDNAIPATAVLRGF